MLSIVQDADALLRARFPPTTHARGFLGRLVLLIWLCGMIYGMVMGSYAGFGTDRLWQVLFSAAKVPLLLLGTFSLCLPSYFVLNTVAGLRPDFSQALQALVAAQAGMTLVLCSLAPFTALWYLSIEDYHAAVLFNGAAFGMASLATQASLRRLYQPLVRRNRKHVLMLRVWLVLYVFVGIQLGWVLRPFVGEPGSTVQLLRADAWGNAYVEVLRHMAGLF